MADAEKYAQWIVSNPDKKGTPEFETVSKAYRAARSDSSPSISKVDQIPDRDAPIQPEKPASTLDKIKGAGEAALTIGTGATTGALGAVGGAIGGIAGSVARGDYGNPAPAAIAESSPVAEGARKLTYEPRTEVGKGYIDQFGRFLAETKLQGLNPAVGIEAAALARPAAVASSGAIPKAAKAAATAVKETPEAYALQQGFIKTAKALKPDIDPQTLSIGLKAKEMGMSVTPDMLTDNKFMRLLGQASRDVPLSGSPTPENRAKFNQAIIGAFGGDKRERKITPQVYASAMKEHGKTIGDLSGKYPIDQTKLNSGIAEYANSIRNETPATRDVIRGYLSDMDKAAVDGKIDGTAFKNLRSELTTQMREESDANLKRVMSRLDDVMLDAIQGNLSAEELPIFNKVRLYYANGKTVEPLIAKAAVKGRGDMSPAALANQVTSSGGKKTAVAMGRGGDLADIAAVGSRFMTEPNSSMTSERGLVYGGLGGSAFANPLIPAGVWGGANLYNRFGPSFSNMLMSAGEKK